MRSAAIVTGVLGAGTVAVFALAAMVSTMFPNGTLVPTSWNGGWGGGWGKPGIGVPMPVPPVPVPGLDGNPEKGGVVVFADGSGTGTIDMPSGTDDDVVSQP